MRVGTCSLACAAAVLLGACGQSGFGETSKVMHVIDDGLEKSPLCLPLPVDVAASKDEFAQHAFELKLLERQGFIEAKAVPTKDIFGHVSQVPGFVTTQAGKTLVQRPGTPSAWVYAPACIRAGRYKVKSIEAIDEASDARGEKVANVRARIMFEPEAWIAETRSAPEVAAVWKSAASNEQQQWMYRLVRSGSDYFFTEPGTKL